MELLRNELLTTMKPDQRVLLTSDHQLISGKVVSCIADVLNQEQIELSMVEAATSTAELSYLTKHSDHFDFGLMVTCIDVKNQICVVKGFSNAGNLLSNITVNVSELEDVAVIRGPSADAELSREINTYRAHVGIQGPLDPGTPLNRKLPIVIATMHGVAGGILPSLLKDLGYTEVIFVPEEEQSDGKFVIAEPRDPDALADGMRYVRGRKAGLLLAVDPAGERMTVTVREDSGDYRLLSSAEVGVLMADYICFCRKENGILSKASALITPKSQWADTIAHKYGIKHQIVASGFDPIGVQLSKNQRGFFKHPLLMATDGQDGYLVGQYSHFSDALSAAVVMSELYCYYESTPGVGMLDYLSELKVMK